MSFKEGDLVRLAAQHKDLRPATVVRASGGFCTLDELRGGCHVWSYHALEHVERVSACTHTGKIFVGIDREGAGAINVEWCPDCGALKRTMVNWECTDYPWRTPTGTLPKSTP